MPNLMTEKAGSNSIDPINPINPINPIDPPETD